MTTKTQLKDYANDKWIYNEKQQRVINRNYKEPELTFTVPTEKIKEVYEPKNEPVNDSVKVALAEPELDYYAHPAMSQSKMKTLLKSPRQYYLKYIAKVIDDDDEHTAPMQLGNCLDWALTEPEKYEALTIKDTKTTKQKDCITIDWKLKIEKWRESLFNYQFTDGFFDGIDFRTIIKVCDTQAELLYTYNDIEWKARTDFIAKDKSFIIDLKSTSATSQEEFEKQAGNLQYYLQSAGYPLAAKICYNLAFLPHFYFLAISTVTGEVFSYYCGEQVQELGMLEIDRGCRLYHHNIATGDWIKDMPTKQLILPQWLENQIRGKNNSELKL